jgi:hypothetical protein
MIEWQEGAVCHAAGRLRYSTSYVVSELTNGVTSVDNYKDFQLNEIRIGDYIEREELGCTGRRSSVIDVFKAFGLIAIVSTEGLEAISSPDEISPEPKRKLTYNQIMAIGKLKRLLDEKSAIKESDPVIRINTSDGLNLADAHRKINEALAKPRVSADKLKTSVDYLNECIEVQAERGKQYDSSGTGERSFDAAAKAFNALTGEKLSGSDVCLLLTCVKVVRQNSDKSRLHDDSLLDGVSYLSLWAEELNKELS